MNVSIDSEIGAQAQDVLASLGLDMNEAVDLFLRQTIRQRNMPFDVAAPMEEDFDEDDDDEEEFFEPQNIVPIFGCLKGKIWMADDFDAPMEEFEEYM